MALEDITLAALEDLTRQISNLTTLFQAIGGLIILYFIFNVINAIINRNRNKKIDRVIEDLDAIKKALVKSKKKR